MSVGQRLSQVKTYLDNSYKGGKLGAQVASNKEDIERGWSVARSSLVRNEAASAASRGLTDVSRRWIIWSEVVQAMDEAEARDYKGQGCCAKTCLWFTQLFSIIEFAFRMVWHIWFAVFWGLLAACRKEDPVVLANVGYHGMALNSYVVAAGVIVHNLCNPGKPALRLTHGTRLDRPVPPIAAGESVGKPEEESERIKPRGLLQNVCFACQAKHPMEHMHRFIKSLFCCMSCHHALHPSLTCGPCCPCCRSCYNTMPQRLATWNDDIEKKRGPAEARFYQQTFGVRSYEEYVQKRLAEMSSVAPAPEAAMQRGADVQDLEEGIALGLLETFVGRGPARGGEPSAPARAALGVFKGIVGIAPREGVEVAGAERGEALSAPVREALGLVKVLVGDLATQAKANQAQATEAVQKLKTSDESKESLV